MAHLLAQGVPPPSISGKCMTAMVAWLPRSRSPLLHLQAGSSCATRSFYNPGHVEKHTYSTLVYLARDDDLTALLFKSLCLMHIESAERDDLASCDVP